MSLIVNGKFVRSEMAKAANGGTEYMSETLVNNVSVPDDVLIHVSRFDKGNWNRDKRNILYVHDLPEDNMYDGVDFHAFHKVVFVSAHQMSRFACARDIRLDNCVVIPNCCPVAMRKRNDRIINSANKIRFIYHTTPHRGLEELVAGFSEIRKVYPHATLDVFSSFNAYGWPERDDIFARTFEMVNASPYMTYHGYQPREVVYEALNDSDVFFYPSKWEETSCIAMIEALRSGVLCVAPNFGALRETMTGYRNGIAYGNVPSYSQLFSAINKEVIRQDGTYDNSIVIKDRHSLEAFTSAWTNLLE